MIRPNFSVEICFYIYDDFSVEFRAALVMLWAAGLNDIPLEALALSLLKRRLAVR